MSITTIHMVATIKIWGLLYETTAKCLATNTKTSSPQDLQHGWAKNYNTYAFLDGQPKRNGTTLHTMMETSTTMSLTDDIVVHESTYVCATNPPSTNDGVHFFFACCPCMNDVAIPTTYAMQPHRGKHNTQEEFVNEVVAWYFLSQWPNALSFFLLLLVNFTKKFTSI